ncbi:sugar transferase [Marinomonas piezotolerans]|uniref:sugar transferase n=1 Tax=Marinomonas piezotolerans TaxID=2213058 RepID=UPI001B862560
MSLVGPRPGLLTIRAREVKGVFAARPGITGLAQISGFDMSMAELLVGTNSKMVKTYL